MKEYTCFYHSPLGVIEINGTGSGIHAISFLDSEKQEGIKKHCLKNYELRECKRQLNEYFHGRRKNFHVKLDIEGTNFQKKVWGALTEIPFGQTVSYKYIAEKIENPKSVRAVGGANNRNRLAILIPCHRVIGSNGKLTGYAAGAWRKEWLIQHEKLLCS